MLYKCLKIMVLFQFLPILKYILIFKNLCQKLENDMGLLVILE